MHGKHVLVAVVAAAAVAAAVAAVAAAVAAAIAVVAALQLMATGQTCPYLRCRPKRPVHKLYMPTAQIFR